MAVERILQIGHPLLRVRADEVTEDEIPETQSLIDDLIETMRAAHGAGLAATQIGVPKRVCVIEVGDNPRYPYKPAFPLTVLINPEIEVLGDERFANYEGCLSVPNLRGIVRRPTKIRITAWDREGKPFERIVEGLSAGTFEHEVDHLDGTLFVDRVEDSRTLCTWDTFEEFHRAEFIERVKELEET